MNDNPNIKVAQTQNFLILAHLKEGNKITGLEALDRFGCIHLPRRIKDLKQSGADILSEWVEVTCRGNRPKRVKRYYLALSDSPCSRLPHE